MPVPDPARHIVWPDGFGTRFTVFVDVEEEFDWTAPFDRAQRATTAMAAFPAAHRRFADRGVGLTCMVDYPIATDPDAVGILRHAIEDGRSAIGTQLHSWVNPPFLSVESRADSYPGNLPPEMEAAKLDALTDAIAAAFGMRPVAYRAGRYGIGPATMRLLASRGYRLDSSVRPGYDYTGDGGPNFSRLGNSAYRDVSVIELPLTTIYRGIARSPSLYRWAGRVPHGRGALARTGLIERIALTPEGMPLRSALAAVDQAVADGERLLVFSFHSPSLAPGHTPYVRDTNDLTQFHHWWDAMLDRLDRIGIQPASLAEILAAAG